MGVFMFKVGQRWKTREGKVVKIIYVSLDSIVVSTSSNGFLSYKTNGRFLQNIDCELDLVEEIPEPRKHRPFANRHEFEPHRDKWVKNKNDGTLSCRNVGYDDNFVFFDAGTFTYEEGFKTLMFEDGTPFGVEVQ